MDAPVMLIAAQFLKSWN